MPQLKSIKQATYTGKIVDILNLQPDDIDIEDIAMSLARQPRFNGHTTKFYSVAQHCVLASQLGVYNDRLAILLHDAAEAYVGDIVTPLKEYSPLKNELLRVEQIVQVSIYTVLLGYVPPHAVWELADKAMFAIECRQLMNSPIEVFGDLYDASGVHIHIEPWSWRQSYNKFLYRFNSLRKQLRF